MANSIVPSEVTGGSVYGVRQVQYTVDGASGKDFVDAVTTAAFKQAAAIEVAASGYVAVVKARQVKVTELGQALAYIAKALGSLNSLEIQLLFGILIECKCFYDRRCRIVIHNIIIGA